MNIALAIKYLYPEADPMRDFMVQDNGPEPVLRAGKKKRDVFSTRSSRQKKESSPLRECITITASTTICLPRAKITT